MFETAAVVRHYVNPGWTLRCNGEQHKFERLSRFDEENERCVDIRRISSH